MRTRTEADANEQPKVGRQEITGNIIPTDIQTSQAKVHTDTEANKRHGNTIYSGVFRITVGFQGTRKHMQAEQASKQENRRHITGLLPHTKLRS